MKRPDAESLEEIEAIVRDIDEAQDAVKQLEERLHHVVSRLGEKIHDRDSLNELAAYLYWMVPEVKSKSIAEALFDEPKIYRLTKHLPAITDGIRCDRCSAEIPFSSRTQLQSALRDLKRQARWGITHWPEGYKLVCELCREEIFAERRAGDAYFEDALRQRMVQLRTMSYREYLQTPEWQERRLRHLSSVGYCCQICSASGETLEVYHKTDERRGAELYQNLFALCEGCHEILERKGKLTPRTSF